MLFSLALSTLAATGLCVDGVIRVDVSKVAVDKTELHELRARGGATDLTDVLANQRYFYTANVEIGSPAQQISLLLDTGSSDTWVFGPQTSGSRAKTTRFDSSASKTYKSNNTQWSIQYGIGKASGTWGTDSLKIGGAQVQSLSIGVATKVSQINQGIVGIGRPDAEATVKNGFMYQNLPLRLQAEGLIKKAAYSLYMNDLNSKDGTILFGGVDHSRYVGGLAVLPITHPHHLGVTLQGMKCVGSRSKDQLLSKPQTAVLDSGTSLSYFDSGTVGAMQVAFNANPSFAIGMKYYCDCNVTKSLALEFGPVTINVPAYQFLWPISQFVNPMLATVVFPQNSCYFGIESSNDGFVLMGDNLLRSMYLVYDITDKQIAIAQAALGNNGAAPQVEAIVSNIIPGTHQGY
ncbi:Acid protease [Wickerhamiella sorbophila]|uniref:Acid protease n=1 Tax=Wickerhamiella sorbophila TaxID=45607 RepID=A0A2T0FH52_9ASCO|nr:Acid protease [Wickerhamiella sorbophila]PRT54314.1 Acid protease [Wickerhamiella sorbophila]